MDRIMECLWENSMTVEASANTLQGWGKLVIRRVYTWSIKNDTTGPYIACTQRCGGSVCGNTRGTTLPSPQTKCLFSVLLSYPSSPHTLAYQSSLSQGKDPSLLPTEISTYWSTQSIYCLSPLTDNYSFLQFEVHSWSSLLWYTNFPNFVSGSIFNLASVP